MFFVDLNSGYLYDGSGQFIHWFSDEQSINLIYSHKIAIICESDLKVNLNSDIFNVIDSSLLIEGAEYKNISKQEIISKPSYVSGHNMHILYFTAMSKEPGEFTTSVKLTDNDGNETYINLGADFYMEDESLYINLANLGVELPDAIQKAIYSVNINECHRDNITLNRKMKELLSNYWDMIANKGSYKSLLNTLKWFEWGDLIRIQEIWKHEDFGRVIYDDRSLCSILEDKYIDTLNNFSKTTHLALYVTMQELVANGYDSEKNPQLIDKVIEKWGKEDLSLKLCLLGNFYETYFMPIHLNLFHSTIENIVYTNTFKIINSNSFNRYDYITNIDTIKCNVKNNSSYILNNVQCQVGPNTIFGKQWEGEEYYEDINIIGVDYIYNDEIKDDNELKTFYTQIFKGVGVIVPFHCEMMADEYDCITESILYLNDNIVKSHKIFNNIFKDNKYIFDINFNILFQKEGKNNISIQFKTNGSKLYTINLSIDIIDVSGMDIKAYKIKHYKYLTDEYKSLMNNLNADDFIFNRYSTEKSPISQYIPTTSSIKPAGVCLNNILVLRGDYVNDYILKQYYFLTLRDVQISDETLDEVYTVGVSKYFWFDPSSNILSFDKNYKHNIYRNDYGYFPEFHYLDEMGSDSELSYIINNEDVLVLIPELPLGLDIDEWDWEFKNVSSGEIIKLPNYQEPYVANLKKELLSPGYYDINFKYKIGETIHTLTRKSMFRKS